MKKIIINIVVVLAIIGGIVWVLKGNKEEAAALTSLAQQSNGYVAVRVEKAKLESLKDGFAAFGNFEPTRELTFVSEISGRVVSINAEKGDKISRSQTMATLDHELLQNEVVASEAAFKKMKADLEKYEKLAEGGAITSQQLEDAKLGYTNADIRLKNAKRKLQDSSIKAPFAGTVNARYIEVGSYLNPGAKMFDIVDVSKLKLVVKVTEAQVFEIQKGMAVTVSSDILPDKSFDGKVTFIGVKADASLNYPVEIEVNNSSDQLKAGMYAQALFGTGDAIPQLTVTRNAIIGSLDHAQVYVNEGNKAVLRSVTTGGSVGERVAIVAGLKEGESVITSGQINLSNGDVIEVLQN
ncbi:efflux RND transporter periplasmic adaptor subunit [uncultured Imperialibacter sp.]|uniref:efflux RND transporter periplasmic adaptor subunit n=1 Tax=uncultured Imperialibacter sp. TaxID=1672639 RepID=UPI0030DB7AE9|tara:strand:+ start:9825 stop:10883 length:1059 start_codon:yes stop_codon:yes gene_type:complete